MTRAAAAVGRRVAAPPALPTAGEAAAADCRLVMPVVGQTGPLSCGRAAHAPIVTCICPCHTLSSPMLSRKPADLLTCIVKTYDITCLNKASCEMHFVLAPARLEAHWQPPSSLGSGFQSASMRAPCRCPNHTPAAASCLRLASAELVLPDSHKHRNHSRLFYLKHHK